MKQLLLTACAAALFATPSFAEMTCVPLEDIDTLSADVGEAHVNNFSLSSGQLRASVFIPGVTFSYSVVNRDTGPVYVSVDIIMRDEENTMIAALSAMPTPYVTPGRTEAVSRETILSVDEFSKVSTICIRAAGVVKPTE
ncbi:hypothetical protein [Martelella mediterranea]|uniref:Uncharacterized protein n=1 Tax=Martelella mediterranea TaxID=293089 RepID=A0A4R3NMH0_9HYPH|nr:hypothetical protein [Martelella mediterranea]TCT35413.1 hypothetical protein EDC90_102668 [Martelella mediterranea]